MKTFALTLSIALYGASSTESAVPAVKGVRNYWVANDGATQPDHIQNFIEDMVVQKDGSVLTWSYWDEGGHSRSVYKDGRFFGFNFDTGGVDHHPSRHARSNGIQWDIKRFYGMGFIGKTAPPPLGKSPTDTPPLVVSSRGDTIPRSWVVDPTSIAFDNRGRLLITDNGPAQNVKIIDVSVKGRPVAVGTFGDSLGVFGGPIRGRTGPKRFWGPRGIGVDSLGRVYVGCTGMPMQVGGGTHIRVFSSLTDTASLIWEVKCLSFVNSFDFDPDSNGTSIHKNSTRFHMDWSKEPKDAWKFAATTTDPFKYPDDPRLWHSLETTFFRRINGKPFLFLGGMGAGYIAVIRFEENSEIGVPAAFFPLLDYYRDSTNDWCRDRRPIWGNANDAVDPRHWYWRDDNGDGQVQSSEFHTYNLVFPATVGFDVDANGDMWWSGFFMLQWKSGGLDKNGVPNYSFDNARRWKVPFTENGNYASRIRYFASQDIMVLTSNAEEQTLTHLYRYDRWSDTAKRTLRWRSVLPYKRPTPGSFFMMETTMIPNNISADTDWVYVGHVQKGPDAQNSGEVSLYNMKTGTREGYIIPGPESNNMSGWVDLPHAMNVMTRTNGEKLLVVEDDYIGKGNVYRWCPRPEGCASPLPIRTAPVVDSSRRASMPAIQASRGKLRVLAGVDQEWKMEVYTQQGSLVFPLRSKGSKSIAMPDKSRFLYVRLESGGETRTMALVQD